MKKPPEGRFFRWRGDEGIAPYEIARSACVQRRAGQNPAPTTDK